MSTQISITRKERKYLSSRFHQFLAAHPPHRFSRHLRNVLLDYISSQLSIGLPIDFDDYLWEFNELFDLLDEAATCFGRYEKDKERCFPDSP